MAVNVSDFIGLFIIISIFDNNYIWANGFNLFLCIDYWLCKTRILTGDDDIQQMPIDVKYAGDSFFEINCILSFISSIINGANKGRIVSIVLGVLHITNRSNAFENPKFTLKHFSQ